MHAATTSNQCILTLTGRSFWLFSLLGRGSDFPQLCNMFESYFDEVMQAYYSTIYCFVHFFIYNSLLSVLYHSFLLRLKFHSNRMVDKRMAKITIFTLEKLSKTIECICHVPLLIFFEWLWSLCCKIWNTFFAAHRVAFKWICFTVIVGNPNDKKSIFNALSGFLWLAARWCKVSWFPFGQHFWYHKSCTNLFRI